MSDKHRKNALDRNKMDNGGMLPAQEGIQYAASPVDGPFETLIQWLYARIPATRGSKSGGGSQAKAASKLL